MALKRALLGLTAAVALAAGGCARPAPPPPPPPPPPAPAPPPRPQVVWTAAPEVAVRNDTAAIALPRPFTRLDVTGRDSVGFLQVACAYCDRPIAGTVAVEDVVYEPQAPVEAAEGTLAEFALAIRDAAAWRRIDSLAVVMAPDFTFGLAAQRDRAITITAWEREKFRDLDQLPRLLDEGLVQIGPDFWVAPREYAEQPGYQGLRLGFQREEGRWMWLFLVRGE